MDNRQEVITISLEEYKELLVIKGKYEELQKIHQPLIVWNDKNKPTDPFSPPYKIICEDKI